MTTQNKPLGWTKLILLIAMWAALATIVYFVRDNVITVVCIGAGYYLTKAALTGSTDS